MKSSYEKREEYIFSKAMLLWYIHSEHVLDVLGQMYVDSFLLFFCNLVETVESYYRFWRRSYIRHYEDYTNSTHEGTNNSLKHRAGAVKPQISLFECTRTITLFADVDNLRRNELIERDFQGEYTHINLEATNRLTTQAALILTSLMEHVEFYVSHHTSKTCWRSCRSLEQVKLSQDVMVCHIMISLLFGGRYIISWHWITHIFKINIHIILMQ